MKKRVLFILHLPPPVHGASMVGKYICESEVVKKTFESHFINLATSKQLGEIGKFSLVKLRYFLDLRRSIERQLKVFSPDLVYVTASSAGRGFLKDFFLVDMIKRRGYPVVVHFHNKGVSTRKGFISRLLYERFFTGVRVMQLSGLLYPDIEEYVLPQNVCFCPNGVSGPDVVPVRGNHPVPRILFCSNLIVSKGVLVLLDACKILMDKGYLFSLDISGGESLEISESRLRREISDRGLKDMVFYHGIVSGDKKDVVFRNADIFTLPTFNDCFPLVILEAMAWSLPVVSTDEGAISEIVMDKDTGIIIKKQSPKELAAALEKLLNDYHVRLEMGKKGRLRYESLYTLEKFELNFTELLYGLCTDSTVCI